MKHAISKILCLIGGLLLTVGCLPQGGPSTAAGPNPLAPTSFGAVQGEETAEIVPEAEEIPQAPLPVSAPGLNPPEGSAFAEFAGVAEGETVADARDGTASPTWMAPSPGSVQCSSTLWVEAAVSLDDRSAMTPDDLAIKLFVKNPRTGAVESLETLSIEAEYDVSIPMPSEEDLRDALASGGLRRVEDEEAAGGTAPGPQTLNVTVKMTVLPTGDLSRWSCSEAVEGILKETFLLEGRYRKDPLKIYKARRAFSLATPEAGEKITYLDDLVLKAVDTPVKKLAKPRLPYSHLKARP